jgi:hypothetical protein
VCYICVYVCMCMYICICVYVCLAVCMCLSVCLCMYVCLYIYVCMHAYMCMYLCIYACMHVCAGLMLVLFSPGTIFPFDHVHSHSSTSAQVTLVLYGVLGSTITRDWHTSIMTALSAHNGLLRYVFRHVVPADEGTTRPTRLQGFGVALDLKNMEYKTLDDRAPAVRITDTSIFV